MQISEATNDFALRSLLISQNIWLIIRFAQAHGHFKTILVLKDSTLHVLAHDALLGHNVLFACYCDVTQIRLRRDNFVE